MIDFDPEPLPDFYLDENMTGIPFSFTINAIFNNDFEDYVPGIFYAAGSHCNEGSSLYTCLEDVNMLLTDLPSTSPEWEINPETILTTVALPTAIIPAPNNPVDLSSFITITNNVDSSLIEGVYGLEIFPDYNYEYVSKGSSDKIEPLTIVHGADQVPPDKELIAARPDPSTFKIIQYTVTSTNSANEEISAVFEQKCLHNYEPIKIWLKAYLGIE